MARLDENEIEGRLAGLPGWSRSAEAITRDFACGDFEGSVGFLNRLTPVAEEMNHHPDVAISWSTVTLTISTHSVGGLTEADFELARRIDDLAR